jgi:hypothetical protein
LRLTLVVDPEGYVFRKLGEEEVRIGDAKVSIYWQNNTNGDFEIWPADKYQQVNPQSTSKTGEYSFLVPPGRYFLLAEADGYDAHQGDTFDVVEGRGVHMNIELVPSSRLFGDVGRGLIILIIVIVVINFATISLLAYNFYRDKAREQQLKK